MKKITIFTLISCITMTISNALHAHTWPITNDTKKTLLIQVELLTSAKPFFAVAKPGQTVEFSWEFPNPLFGFWLSKIKYVVMNDNFLSQYGLQGNFLSADKSAITDNDAALKWLTTKGREIFSPKQARVEFTFWKNGKPQLNCAAADERFADSRPLKLVEKENGDIVANTKTTAASACAKK